MGGLGTREYKPRRDTTFHHELSALRLQAESLNGRVGSRAVVATGGWRDAIWQLTVDLDRGQFCGALLLLGAVDAFCPGWGGSVPPVSRRSPDRPAHVRHRDAVGSRRAGRLQPGRTSPTPAGEGRPDTVTTIPPRRHSCGSRVVWWDRPEPYFFTTKQSAVVRVQWQKWMAGTHYATLTEMLDAAHGGNALDLPDPGSGAGQRPSDSKRLRDVFKNHRNWGELIVQADRSTVPGATGLSRLHI
jgi:hypothetical protein